MFHDGYQHQVMDSRAAVTNLHFAEDSQINGDDID